jgi:uncharacterized cupin superfamily protein
LFALLSLNADIRHKIWRLIMLDKAVSALSIEPRAKKSVYPEPFAALMEGRSKRMLGDPFGLKNFGVNLTTLLPGGMSALQHSHTVQDEFIFILQGTPTLVLGESRQLLSPGMVMGFVAGGEAHQLLNESDEDVIYLEVGDRLPGDSASYPNDDLVAINEQGSWRFTRKDGSEYS